MSAETRMGFFTDTSVCIGCKACEVACKEWNEVPEDGLEFTGDSYDNTGALGASTWRHVAFVEQGSSADMDFRWLMSSDVCKHCTSAACLEVCPTGALFRTEFGTVVVQEDVCNGCGYCVSACPFGVIDRREEDGRAWKCTLCYDRLKDGLEPACAKACPTDSIQFGELDELRERARGRVEELRADGVADARLYGDDPDDGVGGFGAFFLLLDDPEVYGLPPDPVSTTRDLPAIWKSTALAAGALVAGVAAALVRGRR
jgi:formate dehydrogenase iron-sulfur subunit